MRKQEKGNEKKVKKEKSGVRRLKPAAGLRSGDFLLMLFTAALVIFGVIMVFSASYYYSISQDGTAYSYLFRQLAWVAVGTVALLFGATFDYRKYRKVAVPGLIFGAILLVLLFTPLGHSANNATRWIGAGPVTIMPGEFAKLFIILFTAWFFSEKPERIHSLTKGILPMAAVTIVYAILIIKQPNLSTAITVCGIVVAMMLVVGLKWRYVFGLGALGGAGLAFIVLFTDSYWAQRMNQFWDPFQDALGEGYQVAQSLLALGSGGLFGVGLGKSVQKNLYLPEPQNDFILAIIGEELGFIGIILLLALYCCFLWRGVHVAINAPDQFGLLLASGIVLMVGIQVFLNIAVVTASMPPTGINLPFISYGGNALLMFMFSAGVLMNISRHAPKNTGVES